MNGPGFMVTAHSTVLEVMVCRVCPAQAMNRPPCMNRLSGLMPQVTFGCLEYSAHKEFRILPTTLHHARNAQQDGLTTIIIFGSSVVIRETGMTCGVTTLVRMSGHG